MSGLVAILRFENGKVKSATEGRAFGIKTGSLELDLEVKTALHARSTDLNSWSIRNTCPLKVWILSAVSCWVVFCGTNRVRVLSNYF